MKFSTCSVNRKLLPLKAHYFLFLGAQAAVIPYFAAVGRQNGIPETTVAYTFGFVPLAAIACKSLCGYIVDRTQNVTVVLLTLQALLLVSDGVVFFSGSIHTNTVRSEGILQCSEENVTLLDPFTTCSLPPPPECKRLCRESKENGSTSKLRANLSIGNVSDVCSVLSYWNHSVSSDDGNCELTCACYESTTNKSNLWLYTVFLALAWMTGASVFVISDAAVCDALGDNASAFGRQRLWGTISWGICCPIVGIIIDAANRATEGRSGFTPSFYVFAVLLMMDMVLLYRMPRLRMCKQSPTFFRDVATVFKGAEMPVFTFLDLRNPWYALVIELVGGAAFPLAFAAMTVFAKETAPQGTAASVLCVLNAGVEGVGTVLGNVLGGVSFGKNGGRLTFRYIGFASFACAVLCTLSHVVIRRRRPKTSIVPQGKSELFDVSLVLLLLLFTLECVFRLGASSSALDK
ncbi:major facilitator superfamily domain-containing protein 6-B [Ixodes scapularis]